jgi:GxxExxY protein
LDSMLLRRQELSTTDCSAGVVSSAQVGDFRADLVVDGRVIIELKTGREIDPGWEKQLLNYLCATEIEVGLLFNFGPKAQFRRYVFENDRKNPCRSACIRGKEVAGDQE